MTPATLQNLGVLPKFGVLSLQECDLIFCSGTDILSRVIEEATDSVFSHVGMATFDSRSGQWQILQAYEPMVQVVPVDRFIAKYQGGVVVGRWTGVSADQARAVIGVGLEQLGLGYGTMTIAEIAAHIIDRSLPPIIPNGTNWICSQLVAACFSAADLDIPTDTNGFIAPGDIADDRNIELIGTLKTA